MLSFLPSPILVVLNLLLISINCILIATPIMLLGLVKCVLPLQSVKRFIEYINFLLYRIWVNDNYYIINLTNKVNWEITGDSIPQIEDKSCIVMSNHLSWFDILVIGSIFKSKVATTKFFMKHSLIYIPFVGLACYALGMPFLRRYSREKLLKNPKLRQKDIKSTKGACKRVIKYPTALINFVEGTRYTPEKAKLAKSSYKHLMPPKTGSIGLTIGEIGEDIECVFNTTLQYPNCSYPKKPFIEMLKGNITDIYANVEIIPKGFFKTGDFLQDKTYKHSLTMQVRHIWQAKDEVIESMLNNYKKKSQEK